MTWKKFYFKYNEIISSIYIYEEPVDFTSNPLDQLIESGMVTKTLNQDLTNYRLDYYTIIKVLIDHNLITCLAGWFFGAIDNNEIIWAFGYGKIL